jgi:biopolymer transport protein ExbB
MTKLLSLLRANLICAVATLTTALLAGPASAQAPDATADASLPDVSSVLPRDLSPWGMFQHADIVVKAVLIGLVLASLVTWTVCLSKAIELAAAKRRVLRHLKILLAARTLAEADASEKDPVSSLVTAAEREIKLSANMPAEGIKERIALQLERIEVAASRRIGHGMSVLATIGATAPFVGLFGTVWGIMNSFIGISKAHTTNLAVVAPGIAEALLATACGLIAAVPAVVIYNMFARSISGYRALLSDASAQVLRHAGRDLDRGRTSMSRAAE